MDSYRPRADRRTPPPSSDRSRERYYDEDRPSRGGYAYAQAGRAFDSDDYAQRRSAAPSSPRLLNYDEEGDGFQIRGNSTRHQDPYYTGLGQDERVPDARPDARASRRSAQRRFQGSYEDDADYLERADYDAPVYRGDNDVTITGERLKILLIRNLKDSVTEDVLAKGLEKLYRSDESPTGATQGSLRRVILIRSRENDKSMGFGFAEYFNMNEAGAAREKAFKLGDKCTISSKVFQVDFPHNAVFPHADFGLPETYPKYLISMPGQDKLYKYHDTRFYPTEMPVNNIAPYSAPSPPTTSSGGGMPSTSHASASTLDKSDKPSKKRKAPSSAAPAMLQQWQNKSQELRSEEQKAAAEHAAAREAKKQVPASGVNAVTAGPTKQESQSDEQTFATTTAQKKCCYLCSREFKTIGGLHTHLAGKMHTANLADPDAVEEGYAHMKRKGVAPESTMKLPSGITGSQASATTSSAEGADQSKPQYRDRAAERRMEEAQTGAPEKVAFSLKKPNPAKNGNNRANSSSDTEQQQQSTSFSSKAKNMLQKAGWTEGQGLGAGNGVTAPIEQSMYATGVGLGHEDSKKGDAVEEAARKTKGDRDDFVEGTKDHARKRFLGHLD